MTHTPDVINHASVVTRETTHIVLTMAVLHNLEVKTADVLNTYETSLNRERICLVLSLEFGDDAFKSATFIKVLYIA